MLQYRASLRACAPVSAPDSVPATLELAPKKTKFKRTGSQKLASTAQGRGILFHLFARNRPKPVKQSPIMRCTVHLSLSGWERTFETRMAKQRSKLMDSIRYLSYFARRPAAHTVHFVCSHVGHGYEPSCVLIPAVRTAPALLQPALSLRSHAQSKEVLPSAKGPDERSLIERALDLFDQSARAWL